MLGRGVLPAGEPIVTADDLGLVRGDGCFDAMRLLDVDGTPVVEQLDEHLRRFEASADTLGLAFDAPAWRRLIAEAAAAWPLVAEAVLKLVLTRGTESRTGVPTGFLTLNEVDLPSIRRARAGISVRLLERRGASKVTSSDVLDGPLVRLLDRGVASNAFPQAPWLLGGVKLLSYAINSAAKRAADAHGDDDALFTSSDGYALEGPTSTVIVLRNGRLTTTPTGDTGILDSITARRVLQGATDEGVATEHALIPVDALFEADGVWLASSIRGVCPVLRLDGRELRTDADWNSRVAAWGGF